MFKESYHPKAFLSLKRNIRPGLAVRTRILSTLERKPSTAKVIAQEIGTQYAVILYHLHLLEAEKIITRKGKKPYLWELTGIGQRRLTEIKGP